LAAIFVRTSVRGIAKPLERVVGFLSERAQFWREWYHQPASTIYEAIQSLSGTSASAFYAGNALYAAWKKNASACFKLLA